jgi:hypothetical protein
MAPPQMFHNIHTKTPKLKKEWSEDGKDLLQGMLTKDPFKRLGTSRKKEAMPGEPPAADPLGVLAVQQHAWFKAVSWEDQLAMKVAPPIKPKVLYSGRFSKAPFCCLAWARWVAWAAGSGCVVWAVWAMP